MASIDTYTLRRLLEKTKETGSNRTVGLESRCVSSLDYDLENQVMTVTFTARGTYRYSEVPLETYVDFAGAESQGRYFNLYIRERFPTERIA